MSSVLFPALNMEPDFHNESGQLQKVAAVTYDSCLQRNH